MKKIFNSIFIILYIVTISSAGFSQCKDFDEPACKKRLSPYTNYGNYISTTLTDGEYAELNMTFYSNQQYRLAVCGLENVPKLEWRVFDADHNVVFKSKDVNYSRVWDFKLEASQQLIIAIIVPEQSKRISGCIAILNGMVTEGKTEVKKDPKKNTQGKK